MENNQMVDLLKRRFHIEAGKQDRGGVYALTQRKMAYNSNRIEGSTLTEKQTASIFETGTIRADGSIFRTKDVILPCSTICWKPVKSYCLKP